MRSTASAGLVLAATFPTSKHVWQIIYYEIVNPHSETSSWSQECPFPFLPVRTQKYRPKMSCPMRQDGLPSLLAGLRPQVCCRRITIFSLISSSSADEMCPCNSGSFLHWHIGRYGDVQRFYVGYRRMEHYNILWLSFTSAACNMI